MWDFASFMIAESVRVTISDTPLMLIVRKW
jgi:hypothetical protein